MIQVSGSETGVVDDVGECDSGGGVVVMKAHSLLRGDSGKGDGNSGDSNSNNGVGKDCGVLVFVVAVVGEFSAVEGEEEEIISMVLIDAEGKLGIIVGRC